MTICAGRWLSVMTRTPGVIGGGQIYQAAFEWLTRLDITYVPDRIDRPDAVRFPVIDPQVWQVAETTRTEGSELTHVIYLKRPG